MHNLVFSVVWRVIIVSNWSEPINARCGLGNPTARLTSHGESDCMGSLPEYALSLCGPWHEQPQFIASIQPKLLHLQYCGLKYT